MPVSLRLSRRAQLPRRRPPSPRLWITRQYTSHRAHQHLRWIPLRRPLPGLPTYPQTRPDHRLISQRRSPIRRPLRPAGRKTLARQPCRPCRQPRHISPLRRRRPGHHQPLGHQQAHPQCRPSRPRLALPRRSPRQPQRQISYGWNRFQSEPAMNPVPGTSCHPPDPHPRPVTPTRPGRRHCLRSSARRRCHHPMRCRTR